MHSESEIRRSIKILLEAYGLLNTSEVKEHLNEVLEFDEDDILLSDSRNGEIKILQRIGNIVCHQNGIVYFYDEGFLVDKNNVPALWVLTQGINGSEHPIDIDTIDLLRKKLGNHNPRRYRKINWEEVNERNSFLGSSGEEFVLQYEMDSVSQYNPDAYQKVIHLSAKQGDGFGYDILSVDEYGNSKFIEVKTTTSPNPYSPFYMSVNEKNFFEEKIDLNAFIYRVYCFNEQTRRGKILVIPARDLIENFDFDPISFKVTYRG